MFFAEFKINILCWKASELNETAVMQSNTETKLTQHSKHRPKVLKSRNKTMFLHILQLLTLIVMEHKNINQDFYYEDCFYWHLVK